MFYDKKSDAIGDASLIGLQCESGDFSDCDLDGLDNHMPIGCDRILMFSESNSTCGSLCDPKKSKQRREVDEAGDIKKSGWTPFYMNSDKPSGTGDHEHYYYYLNKNNNRLSVYGHDGKEYIGCKKTAMHIRTMETHIPWWKLAINFTILFSESDNTYFHNGANNEEEKEKDKTYHTSLKPHYG